MLKYIQYASLLDLKARDYKVFLYIFDKLSGFDEISINQNRVAEVLDITKSDVSRALRKLEINELIYFEWITKRKKNIGLIEYDNDELDELIEEIIDENTYTLDDWDL